MTTQTTAAKAILAGLVTTQVIASLHVYLSNRHLHQALTAIVEAGWFGVPTAPAMETLRLPGPAFFGGLFFTLTVGCGLSLIAFSLVWLRRGLLVRLPTGRFFNPRNLKIAALILWAALLLRLNLDGLVPMESLYFVFVPLAAGYVAMRGLVRSSSHKGMGRPLLQILPIMPVILLALLWWPQSGDGMFIRIRDHLLLSNPVGSFINDFYYKYTLYPAEAFKPTYQKSLKTYQPDSQNISDEKKQHRLDNTLARYDYLRIADLPKADLTSHWEGARLTLENRHGNKVSLDSKAFFQNPGEALTNLSRAGDRLGFFRTFTFYSLLLGFPVVLYILFFSFWEALAALWTRPATARIVAAGICLATGVAALVPVWSAGRLVVDEKHLTAALDADDWKIRTEAARRIHDKGSGNFGNYDKMLASTNMVEQYWLARALAVNSNKRAHADLIGFLESPDPNVVCQAYYALGRRGDRRAIETIIAQMETSDHWYTQWYGYRALKALGWRQTRSR